MLAVLAARSEGYGWPYVIVPQHERLGMASFEVGPCSCVSCAADARVLNEGTALSEETMRALREWMTD